MRRLDAQVARIKSILAVRPPHDASRRRVRHDFATERLSNPPRIAESKMRIDVNAAAGRRPWRIEAFAGAAGATLSSRRKRSGLQLTRRSLRQAARGGNKI